jgi:succinate dehydrogenase/fumarate reductase flavoprotein subunit
MGGNALTDALVFGKRAGRSAAEFVEDEGTNHPSDEAIEDNIEALSHYRNKISGPPPKVYRERLRDLMWKKVGVVRERMGLEGALESLVELESEFIDEGAGKTPKAFMEAAELSGAFQTARMITEAALRRTESRGSHYRKDFPEQDDLSWKGHIVLERNHEGGIDSSFIGM